MKNKSWKIDVLRGLFLPGAADVRFYDLSPRLYYLPSNLNIFLIIYLLHQPVLTGLIMFFTRRNCL